MPAWLVNFWLAVWPNLAASVLWVPVTLLGQHVLLRWHHSRLHERLDALHRHVEAATGTPAP